MDSIKLKLFQFLNNHCSLNEFEQWVYATPELEQFFAPDDYLNLLAFDYTRSSTKYEASKIVEAAVDDDEYQLWELREFLMYAAGFDAHAGDVMSFLAILDELYELYCYGYGFLEVFLWQYLAIIPDMCYDDDKELKNILLVSQTDFIRRLIPQCIHNVNQIIFWLDQGLIVPKSDDDGILTYEDYRHPSEKRNFM